MMEMESKMCDEKTEVLFGSVIYNNALKYMNELIDSINKQTTKEFCILFLNDGISTDELNKYILPIRHRCRIVEYRERYSPSHLRIKLMQEARKCGADILVIGDADDLFSSNRIKNTIETFKANQNADFVYNELRFFNGNNVMPEMPDQIFQIKDLAEKNFLGMSNTAIRIGALDDCFIDSLLECNSFIFDWYFYTRMLLAGHIGIRVKEAYTLYRIHDENCVGFPSLTENAIKKEIEIKREHYNLLKKRDKLFDALYNCYNNGKIQKPKIDTVIGDSYYWWDFTKAIDSFL